MMALDRIVSQMTNFAGGGGKISQRFLAAQEPFPGAACFYRDGIRHNAAAKSARSRLHALKRLPSSAMGRGAVVLLSPARLEDVMGIARLLDEQQPDNYEKSHNGTYRRGERK